MSQALTQINTAELKTKDQSAHTDEGPKDRSSWGSCCSCPEHAEIPVKVVWLQ